MIREAVAEDGPAIAALERESFGSDAWSDGLVRDGLSGTVPGALYLVAETDAASSAERVARPEEPRDEPSRPETVGYAAASLFADVSELQRIAVGTTHRRRGIASALLDRVELEARRRWSGRLLLEVRQDNAAACAFYAARGFFEINRRPHYYADGTTAVVLAKEL